ncbi:tripartite tricarboxylate transporter TctB family protein [Acuticoccus sp. MNP-M23]|uniref:tripartite tricarboxylate transporter TctB family protein n=1 Tax=Acuticoccus sp. MNP-M23 TaxID=3072793 RepID=UPI002815592D|nr:tripartite tricarboxylate transporter TctB family protein [Acuticoccus sp. MNP-M23]WMS43666.1 tripartite tricarboxylate transporter TctB family protein [Acuticoccus sp. MNP-M23]
MAAAFIAGCLAVLWETRDIPPGTFEPLGSAPVPQGVAALIIALCLAVIAPALRRPAEVAPDPGYTPRPLDAAMVAGLTIAYVAMMQARLLDFAPLTALFLFVTIAFLTRLRLRAMPTAALVAVVTGWGCQYVFTRVFVVDLPGL